MRRFYKDVSVAAEGEGYTVCLDGRPIKTPMKADLIVPTEQLAEEIADEWRAQGETIRPDEMGITKLSNTAIDRVMSRFEGVADEVAAYGASDLICYRAEEPADLIEMQNEAWNPYIEWVREQYDLSLVTTTGIMPVQQPDETVEGFKAIVRSLDSYYLTALHEFTSGFGSLVLALALLQGKDELETLWQISLLDEHFQIEQWGEDLEETELRAKKRDDLEVALRFLNALNVDND